MSLNEDSGGRGGKGRPRGGMKGSNRGEGDLNREGNRMRARREKGREEARME